MEHVLGEGREVEERMPGSDAGRPAYEPPFPYITRLRRARPHRAGRRLRVRRGRHRGRPHRRAFGEDDFRLGEEYGLTIHNPVRPDGTFDERIGPFAGMYVKDADAEDRSRTCASPGRLFRAGEYEHSYPHCWRCDTPLLYYAKANWYMRTTAVRDELLAANEAIEWYP